MKLLGTELNEKMMMMSTICLHSNCCSFYAIATTITTTSITITHHHHHRYLQKTTSTSTSTILITIIIILSEVLCMEYKLEERLMFQFPVVKMIHGHQHKSPNSCPVKTQETQGSYTVPLPLTWTSLIITQCCTAQQRMSRFSLHGFHLSPSPWHTRLCSS